MPTDFRSYLRHSKKFSDKRNHEPSFGNVREETTESLSKVVCIPLLQRLIYLFIRSNTHTARALYSLTFHSLTRAKNKCTVFPKCSLSFLDLP